MRHTGFNCDECCQSLRHLEDEFERYKAYTAKMRNLDLFRLNKVFIKQSLVHVLEGFKDINAEFPDYKCLHNIAMSSYSARSI